MDILAKSIQVQYKKGDKTLEELARINNLSVEKVKSFIKEEDEDKITKFKELVIDEALRFMREDVRNATTKEIKDIVSVVDMLTKKDAPSQPTINIAIQNLVEQFKDDI